MARLSQDDLKRMLPEKRRAYEIRRRKVMRNRKILAVCVALFLTLSAVLVLSLTVLFKIDTITILGDSLYDQSQIINASGIEKGSNLFLSDIGGAKQRIEKNLPYISDAVVSRKFPSAVVIEITGTKAVCCFSTAEGTALADDTLKVLEIKNQDDAKKGLTAFVTKNVLSAQTGRNLVETNTGKDVREEVSREAQLVKTVYDSVAESGIEHITEINISSPGNIYCMYQDRLKLNLGASDKLTYKLKAAVQIILKEDKIDPAEKGEIFLNDTKNFYVSPEKN